MKAPVRPVAFHVAVIASMVLMAACGGESSPTSAAESITTTVASPTTTDGAPSGTPVTPTTVPVTTEASSTTLAPSTTASFEGALAEMTVAEGQVEGGGRVRAELGSVVRLVVDADVSDEVNVHGYDIHAHVSPGEPATIEFTADIPGVFEVEMHDSGLKLADLEVSP